MSLLDEDWEYTGRPDVVPRDNVRELVGDTNKNSKLVSDTSIALALSVSGDNEQVAAAEIAKKIAARFAQIATTKSGKDYSRTIDISTAFEKLAERLRANDGSAIGGAAQIRCGTSRALYGDGDIRRGAFRTGMFHTREHDPRTEIRDQDILDDVRSFDELI